MTRRLVIKPVYGLGNRMMAMASAARLARRLGCDLAVEWTILYDMATPFADLFETEGVTLVSEPDCADCHHYDLAATGGVVVDIEDVRRHDAVKITACSIFYLADDPIDPSRVVFSANAFYQDVAFEVGDCLRAFRPAAEIRERLARIGEERFAGAIGVHMRHHDKVDDGWVGSFTDISRPTWRSLCWSLMRHFPDRAIFLSSNSQEDYDFFDQVGEGRVLYHPKTSLDRGERDSQKDALIDMLLLARTALLVRHGSSTFAYVPGLAYRVPQLVVRGQGEEVESLLCDVETVEGRTVFAVKSAAHVAEALNRRRS